MRPVSMSLLQKVEGHSAYTKAYVSCHSHAFFFVAFFSVNERSLEKWRGAFPSSFIQRFCFTRHFKKKWCCPFNERCSLKRPLSAKWGRSLFFFPVSLLSLLFLVFIRAMSDSLLHFFSHIQHLLRFLYHPQTIHHFFIFRSRLFFFSPRSLQTPFFSLEYTSLLFLFSSSQRALRHLTLAFSFSFLLPDFTTSGFAPKQPRWLFTCIPVFDRHLFFFFLPPASATLFFFIYIFPCLSLCVCVSVYYSLFSCQAPSGLYRITTNTQKKRRKKKEEEGRKQLPVSRPFVFFCALHKSTQ